MGVDLKYDIETINSIAGKFSEMNAEITSLSSELQSTFENLKGQWNTEASKSFFKTVDEDWKKGVVSASQVLTDLEEALKDVAEEYVLIEEAAKNTFK